jgi:hypothetical protein
LRVCIDFRNINLAIQKDESPMLMADMLIDIILYKMMMLDFIGGIREIVSVLQMDLIIVSNTNGSIRINEIIDKYSLSNLA